MIKNLRAVRQETGKTQKEVALDTNIGYKRYNSYETGAREPDAATLSVLAKYFDVSVDYLLGRTDVRNVSDAASKEVEFLKEFDELFTKLSDEQRKLVISQMKWLLDNRG